MFESVFGHFTAAMAGFLFGFDTVVIRALTGETDQVSSD
jgi:hypothetical protein